jgi:hypothetical protein
MNYRILFRLGSFDDNNLGPGLVGMRSRCVVILSSRCRVWYMRGGKRVADRQQSRCTCSCLSLLCLRPGNMTPRADGESSQDSTSRAMIGCAMHPAPIRAKGKWARARFEPVGLSQCEIIAPRFQLLSYSPTHQPHSRFTHQIANLTADHRTIATRPTSLE